MLILGPVSLSLPGVTTGPGAGGGSSVSKAFSYDTTALAWSSTDLTTGNVTIGQAYWVFASPDANGLLTPIVP